MLKLYILPYYIMTGISTLKMPATIIIYSIFYNNFFFNCLTACIVDKSISEQ